MSTMINQFFRDCICLLLLVSFASVYAQNNETNHWYFGSKAGLNFENLNSPNVLLDSAMEAPNGCASISSREGNVLFYTHGDKVYNWNHQIMDNGDISEVTIDDLNGFTGNLLNFQLYEEASQNSLIVPIVDNEGIYYLFNIGRTHPDLIPQDGLYYSVIDMNQNNGLGRVISKNNVLIRSDKETGKISAVHHADGKSIWLMTTSKNPEDNYTSFYAYKVNTDGTIESPIITSQSVGFQFNGLPSGILKFSPDGEKLACSNLRPDDLDDHLFIFDFDNQTGKVSNLKKLLTSTVFFEVVSVHGIEFSNDSKYLYASLIKQGLFNMDTRSIDLNNPKIKLVYQYDIENTNPQSNFSSIDESDRDFYGGALQLARDGKIYRAIPFEGVEEGAESLGVINKPNEFGLASNYTHNSVNLENRQSLIGLPNFIQSYFRTRILNDKICQNETMTFEVDTYASITAAEWDFGDGFFSNDIAPNHTFNQSGIYDVSVTITVNNREISTSKQIIVNDLPNLSTGQKLIQCDDNSDGLSVFNLNNIANLITDPELNESLFFYETIEHAQQNINVIDNPESYFNTEPNQELFVRVVNENGCSSIVSFFVEAIYVSHLEIPDEFVCCESLDVTSTNCMGLFSFSQDYRENLLANLDLPITSRVTLFKTQYDAQTTQNALRSIAISQSEELWIRIEGENFSCGSISPINIILNPQPIINLQDNYILCGKNSILLSGNESNYRHEWLDDSGEVVSNSLFFNVTEEGSYKHIAYTFANGIECSNYEDFTVDKIYAPIFENIEVINDVNLNTIEVAVFGESNYEFSIDGINYFKNGTNSYIFHNIPCGSYIIQVRDVLGCESAIEEQVFLMGFPKFFTPNNDGVNDFWAIKGLDVELLESLKIYNRYGKLLAQLQYSNNFKWDGQYRGADLPVNDYWFELSLKNGEINVGHFTLKR